MIKMVPVLVVAVLMFEPVGQVAGEPRTMADLYIRSYTQQMQEAARTPADIRAEQYNRMYEFCDADHNCATQRNVRVPGVAGGGVVAIQSALA
ncbi:MAG: hypothetical protein A2Y02_03150 [Omnitrophica bacterium GWA2_52_12]|nr:MAG: hypothetical protein A2Y02_03150 [Omnitrophica bacterium GWA2_52_12]